MSSAKKKMNNTSADVQTNSDFGSLEHKRIARLAYSYWEARGQPYGSPDEDWFRAEEELRQRKSAFAVKRTYAGAHPAPESQRICNVR